MQRKIGLSISGGATKISGLFGAVEVLTLDYGIKPDYVSGISAGAILALPLVLGKHDRIREQVTSIELSDFFSQSPVSKRGGISFWSIWNVLRGRNYLGRMDNLYETLRRNVSKKEFDAYRKDKTLANVIVMAVNIRDGRRHYRNLKDCKYEDMLDWVVASSSIPGYVNPVNIDGMMMYDGGLRDHSIGYYLMSNFDIEDHYSIYSRPRDIYEGFSEPGDSYNNVLQVHERTLEMLLAEISDSDQHKELFVSHQKGIKNTQIFMPRVLQSQYDVDHGRLTELYHAARQSATQTMKKVI